MLIPLVAVGVIPHVSIRPLELLLLLWLHNHHLSGRLLQSSSPHIFLLLFFFLLLLVFFPIKLHVLLPDYLINEPVVLLLLALMLMLVDHLYVELPPAVSALNFDQRIIIEIGDAYIVVVLRSRWLELMLMRSRVVRDVLKEGRLLLLLLLLLFGLWLFLLSKPITVVDGGHKGADGIGEVAIVGRILILVLVCNGLLLVLLGKESLDHIAFLGLLASTRL